MGLMRAFLQGIMAGYGIAIPVGAVTVLIIDAGLRQGFRAGFAAAAGAATADLTYALLAAAAGTILSPLLAPYAFWLNLGGGAVLAGMGFAGLRRLFEERKNAAPAAVSGQVKPSSQSTRTYSRFLAITLLNPMTIIYFAALILGGGTALHTNAERLVFVVSAGIASLSWSSFMAGIGAFGRHYLSPRFRLWASLAGNLIVIGLAIRLVLQAV
jgi:arginine exporter protein ArgO